MSQIITSRQNEHIKNIIKLYNSKVRIISGLFVAEGFHNFELALKNNLVKEVYVLKEIPDLDENIKQFIVNEDILKKISKTVDPQGIIFIAKFSPTKKIRRNKVLYLDNISDPGNLGTILRTALAFNYFDIILSENTCDLYNPKVIQGSQGAIFKLNIIKGNEKSLLRLKNQNYQLIVTSLKANTLLSSFKANKKHVLILGNEARGVAQSIIAISDVTLKIEIKNIDSLNVAIASAILMYDLSQK